ncbi:hypothetical protein AURDEDRAFT_176016 [Auricularia subglabra TFB-10046 SS5]|uniref:Uncharacterized protein n=1 Tax=Auricularia subglabra (strain TFB-10046 / SS5) TaxID=717982 RepID=J0WQU3_AURST|nr:hypothetical protein AURDEDRAFT_176016 [Auricularia subglabra TFB-10046 SS5]
MRHSSRCLIRQRHAHVHRELALIFGHFDGHNGHRSRNSTGIADIWRRPASTKLPHLLNTMRECQTAAAYPSAAFQTTTAPSLGCPDARVVFRLNSDVLCLVFEALLADRSYPDSRLDLGPARLVCSLWNSTILSHPSLWRYVVIYNDAELSSTASTVLPTALRRSGDCPLSVALDLSGSSPCFCFDVCAAIAQHIDRLQSLSMVLASDAQLHALKHFERASSRLRSLTVAFVEFPRLDWFTPFSPTLFNERNSLTIGHTGLSVILRPEASLSLLRTLVLSEFSFIWAELEHVFSVCPALEDFSIMGFGFAPGGDTVPQGELTFPLRRLALDKTFMGNQDVPALLAAFARLPLRFASVVEIGPDFPFEHETVFPACLNTLFDHLPILDTLSVIVDDGLFCMEGTPLDPQTRTSEGVSRSDGKGVNRSVQRAVRLPAGTSKIALRRIQGCIRAELASALFFQPKCAFEAVSKLSLPLSVAAWQDIERLESVLPEVVELDIIWDLRSFDERVPTLPRLEGLRIVRLLRPKSRERMVLTADKVARLLGEYRMSRRPVLVLRGVQVIMLERDLDRYVMRVEIEEASDY